MFEKNLKITNQILDFFYGKGLKPEIDIRNGESNGEVVPEVQIDIASNVFPAFAIFYNLKEEVIQYSSIVKLAERIELKHLKKLRVVYKSENDVFEDVIAPDDDLKKGEIYEVHFFTKCKSDEFDLDKLEKIYDALTNYDGTVARLLKQNETYYEACVLAECEETVDSVLDSWEACFNDIEDKYDNLKKEEER